MMQIECKIEKIVFGGLGLTHHNGKVIFVDRVLEGEVVLIKIVSEKKNYSVGELVSVIKPSPYREEEPCEYINHCGGCQYQHMSYKEELRIKKAQVLEGFDQVTGIYKEVISDVVSSPSAYGYRNGITLHPVNVDKKKKRLGFIGKDNHSVIPINKCLLASDALNRVLNNKPTTVTNSDMSLKVDNENNVVSSDDDVFYKISLCGQDILSSSKGFFQNNLNVTAQIIDQIKLWCQEKTVDIYYDLYAGCGALSLLAFTNQDRVIAIEENAQSVIAMRANKENLNREQYEVHQGSVEKKLIHLIDKNKNQSSTILLDPPRSGLKGNVTECLRSASNVKSIIYLSCNLTSLVRDLNIILSQNKYDIKAIISYDMFPRTKHIEILTLLTSKVE